MPESLERIVKRIKSLQIQGAKQIAVESLEFLRVFSKQKGFGKEFDIACKKLEQTRPTAVVLHNCLKIIKKEKNIRTIDRLLEQLRQATVKIAKVGAPLIKGNYKIMTHCHSGEALAVIKEAWRQGKKIEVIATETEPKHQGIKTAKELHKFGIPVVVIEDPANGFFMPYVDCVIVGCDAFRKDIGLVNKIGTYPMAVVAKKHKKPFYVVASTFKLDKRKKLIIEERPTKEVYADLKELKGIKIRNPAFDTTDIRYIKKVICEKGVMTPKQFLKLQI